MQKHCKGIASLALFIASLIWNPAVASETKSSPVLAPSGRLYLTGSFGLGKVPRLLAVCLFKDNEPQPSVGWYPEPFSTSGSPLRESGGRIVVKAKNGKSVTGTWDRVPLFDGVIPGPGRLLGWGWVAVVPYLVDARGFDLLENDVSLGGQTFGDPKPWEPLEFKVISSMVMTPCEDEPTDLMISYAKPTRETLVHITQPTFQATNGHWGFWKQVGDANWKPLRLSTYPDEDAYRLTLEWKDAKWIDKYRDALRLTTSDWLTTLPGKKAPLPVTAQDQGKPFTLRTFLLKSDTPYPMAIEVLYRRAHGLTVVEDHHVFQLSEPPPLSHPQE